jgi:hypothetical protein
MEKSEKSQLCEKISEEMLASYIDLPPAHKILKVCDTAVFPWAML